MSSSYVRPIFQQQADSFHAMTSDWNQSGLNPNKHLLGAGYTIDDIVRTGFHSGKDVPFNHFVFGGGTWTTGRYIDQRTGSFFFEGQRYLDYPIHIGIASHTGSTPTLKLNYYETKDGIFNFVGGETLNDKLNSSYDNIYDDWGVGINNIHFINSETGSEGILGDYNTYHYENRSIFNIIGDVETI